MRVIMRLARVWQDGGRERPLDVGQTYDLPDVVANALIATGAAVRSDEGNVLVPPDTTPIDAKSGSPARGAHARSSQKAS